MMRRPGVSSVRFWGACAAAIAASGLAGACVGEITGGGATGGGVEADAAEPGGGTPDAADPGGGGGTPDAAEPGAPDAAAADAAGEPDALDFTCREPVANPPNGMHNAGLACQNCHDGTGPAPLWTLAGTLYTDANGSAALAGGTITVTDADGQTFDIVTATNGNFWTNRPVAYPVQIVASRCPDAKAMPFGVEAPGSCNAGGCHSAPGGNGPGRIHLP
jgi:hypothetical protein